MAESWMKEQTISDIQTAIQTQTIQTALEKNTSSITDSGYQGFLQNAPIPRAYFNPTTTTTLTNNVEVTVNYVAADIVFDPYVMFAGSNQFRIPVDGFYSIDAAVGYQQPAGSGSYQHYGAIKSGVSKTYALNSYIKTNQVISTILATSPFVVLPVTTVRPFRAGDLFYVVAFQVSSANETMTNTGNNFGLSIVWHAPFNQYQGGQ